MRVLIDKFGHVNTVIIITVLAVLFSDISTFLVFFLRHEYGAFPIALTISTILPAIGTPATVWPLMRLLMKIDRLEKEMRTLVTRDSLTGLLSRRAFLHDAKSFIDIAEREKIPFSVIALDIDRFKSINDSFGHAAGDDVLIHFSKTVTSVVRKGDLVGRIGGEEFAILLPNTTQKAAYTLAQRLHEAVRESVINYDQSAIKYTVSMGLVSMLANKSDDIKDIIKAADKLLYLAKKEGRNRTAVSDTFRTEELSKTLKIFTPAQSIGN